MILVDTSVWIDHLRARDKSLVQMLDKAMVLSHPFVIGELALGNLAPRAEILRALSNLPRSATATDAEVLRFIDRYALYARGIGYVDAHLLAAVRLTPDAELWTRDKRLRATAEHLGFALTNS